MKSVELNLSFSNNFEVEQAEVLPAGDVRKYYYPGASVTGGHDGLIVCVKQQNSSPWYGVFAYGDLAMKAKSGIYTWPDERRLCVVSRGEGYIVRVDEPTAYEEIKTHLIMDVRPVVEKGLVVIADPWELFAYDAAGLRWKTGRIAMEGLKITSIESESIRGKINMLDEEEIDFVVNLKTGKCQGGMPGMSG